jgi:hypothetical protein
MRKIILLFACFVVALFLINSCKKSDINGYSEGKGLIPGEYITLDSVINESLDFSNPSATVSIKVTKKGILTVKSINIYVATGSNANDSTGWVLIKNVPYSDGVVLSVSTAELGTALAPNAISPGNSYVFQNEVVTSDGSKFSVLNTPTNFVSLPGYNMALTWQATAVCAFDQTAAVGNYTVVSDSYWEDFSPGDVVTVTAGANSTQLLLTAYPNPAAHGINRVPIVINVDPVSDVATVSTQVVGAYSNWSYGNLSVQSVGTSNFVFSCTGSIQLTFDFTVAAGDFGDGSLILQHQ